MCRAWPPGHLNTLERASDLGRTLPSILTPRAQVRRSIDRECHFATIQPDERAQRLPLDRLLAEVGYHPGQCNDAAREQVAALLGEDGMHAGRGARDAARRRLVVREAVARCALEKGLVSLRDLPREELKAVVELVTDKAAREAEVGEVVPPHVDGVVHDQRHSPLAQHASQALVVPTLTLSPAADATCETSGTCACAFKE